MVQLLRKNYFSAAHFYYNPVWSEEKNRRVFGLCANTLGHGHDYVLETTVTGYLNRKTGMVMNISEMDQILKSFLKEFDGKFLNYEHPYFETHIPTTENMVQYMWQVLHDRFAPHQLQKIRLYEQPGLFSEMEEDSLVQFTRTYHFSAAHRLHSKHLTEEENKQLFGKCNNPFGHGHNYYLKVTVKDEIDPSTGMVMNLSDLDETVKKVVIDKFDHKHLNLETDEFKDVNPTSEMMAVTVYDMLAPHLSTLYKIGIWETEKNYFEYRKPTG